MLTEEQIILLNNLIYKSQFTKDKFEGKTVGEILKEVPRGAGQEMNKEEWDEIFRLVNEDKDILSLKVRYMNSEPETGAKMACFVDTKTGQAYAVFAGTGANEWRDDCIAGTMADSPQQEKALTWLESLPYDNIIVSGHSKGGNKAMYVTVASAVKNPYKVKECYAFDGEGFSAEFCEKYKEQISLKKETIHLTSHYRDFVNVLLYSIAGDVKYIVNDEGVDGAKQYHAPNSMFAFEEGKITSKLAEGDAYSQDPVMEMLGGFTVYLLENATEAEKILALSVLGEVLTKLVGGKDGVTREDILEQYGGEALDVIARYFTKYLNKLSIENPKKYKEVVVSIANYAVASPEDSILKWLLSLNWDLNSLVGINYSTLSKFATNVSHIGTSFIDIDESIMRDFSQATKEIILDAAKETEEEAWWDFTKWDLWYRFEDVFGFLDLDFYTEKVDDYYRKLIDINGSSVKEIEKIFESVYNIDDTYSKKMETATNELVQNVLNKLMVIRDSLVPDNN